VGIVSRTELHKYMSEPEWSPGQQETAANLLVGLEGQLEDRLFGAPISPRDPVTETAGISPRGIVMTEYPVFSVSLIAEVVVDDAHPLAAPYTIRDGYVRVDQNIGGISDYPGWPPSRPMAAITLTYVPGWGPKPALRQAILEKASTIMQFYHDDTMVARATDGQRLPALPPRNWTDDEVKSLGTYRNLSLVM
jgi:hypothetical protein